MAPAMKRPGKPGGPAPQKPANTKATFLRLLGYLGKSKAMLAVVFVFVAFSALAAIIGTSFIKTVTDEVLPSIIANGGKDLSPLIKTLVTLAFIYIFGVVSSYCYSRIMLQVSHKTLNLIRKSFIESIPNSTVEYIVSRCAG